MRVGEILLERGWVDGKSLARALAEQRQTGKRLCSLLISRGLLDFDHAAQALAEQHGVSAILERHVENRERALTRLIPAELARARFALPIGRNRDGELVVCVRDPSPALGAELARAIGEEVVIATCPASQLQHLIDLTYEASPLEEYEVDLATSPERATLPGDPPDLSGLTLVELDDIGVAKDPTMSIAPTGPGRITTTLPPQVARTTGDHALAAIAVATSRDAATEAALRFAQARWNAALLLAINDGAALGHRGFGPRLSPETVETVAIPLASPSIVRLAHEHGRLAFDPPADAGAVQERLVRLLGRAAMAAPVTIDGAIECVLAVGDPVRDTGDTTVELERLVATLGTAYSRLARRT